MRTGVRVGSEKGRTHTLKYTGIRRIIGRQVIGKRSAKLLHRPLNHARIARSVLLLSGHISLSHLAWRLAEVERAAALLRSIALGKQIKRVETLQDDLVYANTTHDAFVGNLFVQPQ